MSFFFVWYSVQQHMQLNGNLALPCCRYFVVIKHVIKQGKQILLFLQSIVSSQNCGLR